MQAIATETNLKLILALILALLSLLKLKNSAETPLNLDFKEIKRQRRLLQSDKEEDKPIQDGYAVLKIIDNYVEMYRDAEPEKIEVEQIENEVKEISLQQNRIAIYNPSDDGDVSDEQRSKKKKTKAISKMVKNEKKTT